MPRNIQQTLLKFDNYTAKVTQLKEVLSNIDSITINKSEDGKWSIGQICYHLYMSESGTLQYIQKRIKEGKVTKTTGFNNFFNNTLLAIALKVPIKYKAPKAVSEVPPKVDIKELMHAWEEQNEAFRDTIRNLPKSLADKEIFNHPIAGKFNIDQTINFIIEHYDHHLPQIKNLLKP